MHVAGKQVMQGHAHASNFSLHTIKKQENERIQDPGKQMVTPKRAVQLTSCNRGRHLARKTAHVHCARDSAILGYTWWGRVALAHDKRTCQISRAQHPVRAAQLC